MKEKWKGKGNNKNSSSYSTKNHSEYTNNETEKRKEIEEEKRKEIEKIDSFFEFEKYEENIEREGFLINIKTVRNEKVYFKKKKKEFNYR